MKEEEKFAELVRKMREIDYRQPWMQSQLPSLPASEFEPEPRSMLFVVSDNSSVLASDFVHAKLASNS